MYPFNTLHVCYRLIEDVHVKFDDEKIISDKFTAFLT